MHLESVESESFYSSYQEPDLIIELRLNVTSKNRTQQRAKGYGTVKGDIDTNTANGNKPRETPGIIWL